MRAPLIDDASGGRTGGASTVNGEPAAELNRGRGGKTPAILLRWTLFAALFAGLLGMHVLTVGHRDEVGGSIVEGNPKHLPALVDSGDRVDADFRAKTKDVASLPAANGFGKLA